jgi:hypothetical protein
MIGHLVPVPSETGASDGDTENRYIIARYRVLLTKAEYRTLASSIKKLEDSSPVWQQRHRDCGPAHGNTRSRAVSVAAP